MSLQDEKEKNEAHPLLLCILCFCGPFAFDAAAYAKKGLSRCPDVIGPAYMRQVDCQKSSTFSALDTREEALR
jgi:hypothetical protein